MVNESIYRIIAHKAFGNSIQPGLDSSPLQYPNAALTPFRIAVSAGDINGINNSAANIKYGYIANQNNTIGRYTNSTLFGSVNNKGKSSYVGNNKYVYDSSNYIKYKKIYSVNKEIIRKKILNNNL